MSKEWYDPLCNPYIFPYQCFPNITRTLPVQYSVVMFIDAVCTTCGCQYLRWTLPRRWRDVMICVLCCFMESCQNLCHSQFSLGGQFCVLKNGSFKFCSFLAIKWPLHAGYRYSLEEPQRCVMPLTTRW